MTSPTITWQEFVSEAKAFLDISNKLKDDWSWHQKDDCEGNSFLLYRQKVPFYQKIATNETSLDHTNNQDETSTGDNVELLQIEYHVVYSISYQVPVLYFQAHKSNGSVLGLEEAWSIFRTSHCDELADQPRSEMLSILTQMDHPVLFRPYLGLHPCRTSELLAQTDGVSANRILTFISLMGPFVQLQLRNEYGLEFNP